MCSQKDQHSLHQALGSLAVDSLETVRRLVLRVHMGLLSAIIGESDAFLNSDHVGTALPITNAVII